MKNIIWLAPPKFSGGLRSLANKYLRAAKIDILNVRFAELTAGHLMKKGKTKFIWDSSKTAAFDAQLAKLKPDLIIVNDKAALGHITGKYMSLALCRGSIYYWNGIPCLVVDDVRKTKSTRIGGWITLNDMQKLKRWIDGTQRQEPRFNLRVCKTVSDVRELAALAEGAVIASQDIETTGVTQSCTGYTVWTDKGELQTYVVPFIDTTKPDGCYWEEEEDEIAVWKLLQKINAGNVIKLFQNGGYDNAYFVRDRVPTANWFCDTLHMFHSIWTEAPKRIDFIASICLDYHTFWKDEGKEDEKEDKKGGAIPRSKTGLENYWRYNGLDTHNTLLCCRFLVHLLTNPAMDWALKNYVDEFKQQTGPAFAMTMRGIACDANMKARMTVELLEESDMERGKLLTMVDDPDFNPGSPQQVAELIYSTLQAAPVKKGKMARSTVEPILKMVQTQHPILDIIIEQIWKVKKPANNNSKYGAGLRLLNNRFMYSISAGTTDTARYASKGHQFWLGTNIQNVPEPMRVMLQADPGYVLVDADYSQSDAYFTAFTSGDKQFMETMLSPDDTHCIHAAHFFKKDFDEVVRAKNAKEDWVVHKLKGIRSITKRVVYGANYMMTAYTLYITMGKKAVVAAAQALGYENAHSWSDKQLIQLCDAFLRSYFQLYPELQPWLSEEISKAAANGNRASCAGGRVRIFFGDLLHDEKLQKEFAAYFGQGGTAMNINRAMCNIFYGKENLEKQGVMLLFQVHDSIVYQVPESRLDLIERVNTAMANECEVYGRKFTVPVEAQVGIGWGKRMIDWHAGVTLEEIKSHERKWQQQWRGEKR